MSAADDRNGRGLRGGEGEVEEREPTDWEVVWHAPNHALGGMVKNLLTEEGLLVMMRSLLGVPHLGYSGPVEILVPSDMADEARGLIEAFIGAAGAGLTVDPDDEQEGDPELPDDDEEPFEPGS